MRNFSWVSTVTSISLGILQVAEKSGGKEVGGGQPTWPDFWNRKHGVCLILPMTLRGRCHYYSVFVGEEVGPQKG